VLAGLGSAPLALADTYCDANVPCAIGYYGKYNVCGMDQSIVVLVTASTTAMPKPNAIQEAGLPNMSIPPPPH